MDPAGMSVKGEIMKSKVIWGVFSLMLCVMSGVAGAYSMMLLQEHKANGDTLQVHKLELIDAHKGVRAVFSVEDDGSVFLRMLSRENMPVVELGVNENPGPYKLYTPSGSLTMRDGGGGCTPDCVNDLSDSDTQSGGRSYEAGWEVGRAFDR